MTSPSMPQLMQAALARRLDIAQSGQEQAQSADQTRQYYENSAFFQKPSNVNRRKSQDLKTAQTNPQVIV